jgi:hypothetical protein
MTPLRAVFDASNCTLDADAATLVSAELDDVVLTTGWITPELSTFNPFAVVVSFVLMPARFPPDSCAAPVGNGRVAAETGCVTPEPSVLTGVMPEEPCMVKTSADGVPAVPIAGCLADVAAPVGNGSDVAVIAILPRSLFRIDRRFPASCAAPVGSGNVEAETGCVTPEPSVLTGVMPEAPCIVKTSAEGVPDVPRAGCLAAVAAPVGSGSDAAVTGWGATKFGVGVLGDGATTIALSAVVAAMPAPLMEARTEATPSVRVRAFTT